jgi:hypothetical protein
MAAGGEQDARGFRARVAEIRIRRALVGPEQAVEIERDDVLAGD